MTLALLKPQVTRNQVEEILSLAEAKRSLERRASELDERLTERVNVVLSQIGVGESVFVGPFTLVGHETSRRYPKWAELFKSRLGAAEAQRVLEATEPKVSTHIVINGKRV